MKLFPTTRGGRWRLGGLLAVLLLPLLAYAAWSPGEDVRDGRHDRGRNGIWLGHAWLGDDAWFIENEREAQKATHRGRAAIERLAAQLREHRITDLFPHLAPASLHGPLPAVDDEQAELFLDVFDRPNERVMPWIGGVRDKHVFPASRPWREAFVASVLQLLDRHPRLAGVHLNVEPWPTGDQAMATLLDELRAALPAGKILSVAAYPPPTRWHPHPQVHWDLTYFLATSRRCDQMVVMMYDTGILLQKPYRKLMADWTRQVHNFTGEAAILLGLPAYEDEGVGYHTPRVENLRNGLLGIHAGLDAIPAMPEEYQGIALYAHWTMDDAEWRLLRGRFLAGSSAAAGEGDRQRGE